MRRESTAVSTLRRAYGTSRYGQLHYAAAGPNGTTDKTPVVCFHQSPISGAQFKLFQRAMAVDRFVPTRLALAALKGHRACRKLPTTQRLWVIGLMG